MKKWLLMAGLALLIAGCGKEEVWNLPEEWRGYELLVLVQPAGAVHGELNIIDVDTGNVIGGVVEGRTGIIPNDMLILNSQLFILGSYDSSLNVFKFPHLQTSTVVELPQGSNPWEMVYANGKIFTTLWRNHQVAVIDKETLELLNLIDLPSPATDVFPYPLNIIEHNGRIYVALSSHDDLFVNYYKAGVYGVIDSENMEYLETVTVPAGGCFNLQALAFKDENLILTCAGDWGWTQGGVLNILNREEAIFSTELPAGIIPGHINVFGDKACIGSLTGGDIILLNLNTYNINIVSIKDSGFVSSCAFLDTDRVVAGIWDSSNNENIMVVNTIQGMVEKGFEVKGPVQKVIVIK